MDTEKLHAEIGKKFIIREQLTSSLNQTNQEIQALYNQIQEEGKKPTPPESKKMV